jgi:hypothetical protein
LLHNCRRSKITEITERPDTIWKHYWDSRHELKELLVERINKGEIPQEVLELFCRWLSLMERREEVGERPWIDHLFTFLALSEEDRYAYMVYLFESIITSLEKQLENQKH